MAVLSEDPVLLDIIKQGRDAHAATVRKVWPELAHLTDQEIKEKHKAKRDIAKVTMFSLAYGARAKKIAFILDIPVKEAERVLSTFKSDVYPTLSKWLDDAAEEVKTKGQVDIVGGYRRRFKPTGNDFVDQGTIRSIVNSLIQGASAYITKICTLRVLAALNAAGIHFKLIILIHDSITIQVEDKDIKRAYDIVADSMKFVMHGVTLRSEGAVNKDMSKLTEQKITDLFESDEG